MFRKNLEENEFISDFSKSEILTPMNMSISNNEYSNYQIDDNLHSIPKQQQINNNNDTDKNILNNLEIIVNKNKNPPKNNINPLLKRNETLNEIYMLLNKHNILKSPSFKKEIKLFSKTNYTNNNNALYKYPFNNKNHSTNIKGKFFSIYQEISHFGKTENRTLNSKSLENFFSNNINNTKQKCVYNKVNSTFKLNKQSRNNQNKKSLDKKDKKINIEILDDFYYKTKQPNEKKKPFISKELIINKWINNEKQQHGHSFYKEKQKEISSLLSNIQKFPISNGIPSNIKQNNLIKSIKKNNLTYEFYSNDYYKKELNKFTTRLYSNNNTINNNSANINSISKGDLFSSINYSNNTYKNTLISPFYRSRRINLYKKVKSKQL